MKLQDKKGTVTRETSGKTRDRADNLKKWNCERLKNHIDNVHQRLFVGIFIHIQRRVGTVSQVFPMRIIKAYPKCNSTFKIVVFLVYIIVMTF